MDCLKVSRGSLLASIDNVLLQTNRYLSDQMSGQNDLFAGLEQQEMPSWEYVSANNLPFLDRVRFEKQVLGFYLTGHPIDYYQDTFKSYNAHTPSSVLNMKNKTEVLLIGSVHLVKRMFSRDRRRFAFVALADAEQRVEVAVYADVYSHVQSLLEIDTILCIRGYLQIDELKGRFRVVASQVYDYLQWSNDRISAVTIHLKAKDIGVKDVAKVRSMLGV